MLVAFAMAAQRPGCYAYVDETVTSSLWADQTSTPRSTLASQDTLPFVALSAVGTEKVTNLATSNTNVTSRHIGISANVLVELPHEGNAELADLVVGLALGVEVGTTLATAHIDCDCISISLSF